MHTLSRCREGGDANKRWSFLPPEKQYVITKNGTYILFHTLPTLPLPSHTVSTMCAIVAVPCLQRASAVLSYAEQLDLKKTEQDVEGGDWVATSSAADVNEAMDEYEELPALHDGSGNGSRSEGVQGGGVAAIPDVDDDGEERHEGGDEQGVGVGVGVDDIPDISHLDLEGEDDDDAIAGPNIPSAVIAEEEEEEEGKGDGNRQPSRMKHHSDVLQTRTYDVLISYDNYYRTPRVWLIGYGEDHTPLTQDQIMEDVISDYFSHRDRKTVTVEDHPHRSSGGKVVSIHPCRHAEVMKKLSGVVSRRQEEEEDGGEEGNKEEGEGPSQPTTPSPPQNDFKVEHYMVLFLKFISSVVPSISYDYTMPAGM